MVLGFPVLFEGGHFLKESREGRVRGRNQGKVPIWKKGGFTPKEGEVRRATLPQGERTRTIMKGEMTL